MKKTTRLFQRLLCVILALVLMTAIASVGVSAEKSEQPLIKGSVTLDLPFGTETQTHDYYYSDSYFSASGKISDPHLRTLSAAIALTSYKDYETLLDTIGFGDIAAYDMDTTSPDTMGVVLAHKEIGGMPVVIVMLRGDKYYREWASNFISGTEGDAEGFADAAALTDSRLRVYLSDHGITKAKYWVTGYSRAGAVADLLGVKLNQDAGAYGTTDDDIYVYTIEAPACSADPTVYENIHNISDCCDPIPYVYPAAWGLALNGVREEIGDPDTTIMGKTFYLSKTFMTDYKEVNASEFLDDFMDFLTDRLSREVYAETLQNYVSRIADIYFSMSEEEQAALMDYLAAVGKDITADSELFIVLLDVLSEDAGDIGIEEAASLILRSLDKAADEVGHPLSEEDYQTLKDAVPPLAAVMVPLIRADARTELPAENGGTETAILYHLMTFIGNAGELISHHFNSSILDALEKLDAFYQKRADRILGDADGDGEVGILDATVIQRRLAMMEVPEYDEAAADVDRDGKVTIIDVTYIQRYDVFMTVEYPIGELIAE